MFADWSESCAKKFRNPSSRPSLEYIGRSSGSCTLQMSMFLFPISDDISVRNSKYSIYSS